MASRRKIAAAGLLALLFGTGVIEYHGSAGGLVLIGIFVVGGVVGYRAGSLSRGALYGALAGVGLTMVGIVLVVIASFVLVVVTIPEHGGMGFMGFGIAASMLASPLGPLLAGLIFGGVALFGGAGGLVGGALARADGDSPSTR